MAQLKDLIVTGASRFIGDVIANQLQITKLNAPATAGGTTYSLGSDGQVLLSNGSSVYWGSAAPTVTESTVSDWGFVKIGTSATTAAAGNHTHATSLAADSGTASVTLAHNTTYKLTAGGTNVIFKTPALPTNISSFTNDAGYITSADVPEGASAYAGTISAVGTTASTGTNNGFARGDHVHNITKATINSVLGTGSGTAKFYREDGTWATPAYIANTDEKLKIAAVTSGTTYYPIVAANSTAAANRQYDATGFAYTGTNGTTSAVGVAKITLGNSTASGTANNKQGSIVLYGSTAYATTITPGGPTAARTITLPNATGTVALAANPTIATDSGTATVSLAANTTYKLTAGGGSLIFKTPTIPTTVSSFTNDSGYITSSNIPEQLFERGTGSDSIQSINPPSDSYPATASGAGSFALSSGIASGQGAVAIGMVNGGIQPTASGNCSFSMGLSTIASANYSMSVGQKTLASGRISQAFGNYTIASGRASMSVGQYNIEDTDDGTNYSSFGTGAKKYIFTIGNGTADDARSNALTVDWNGNTEISGYLKTNKIQAPTTAGGSTYGSGSAGQVLTSDGTNTYWGVELNKYYGSLATNGWKNLGGRTSGNRLTVSYNNAAATWNAGTYSASLLFGCNDTKGLLDIAHASPVVSFGGGSVSGTTDNDPKWYYKLSGTSGCTYTLPTATKTLAASDGSNATGTWTLNLKTNKIQAPTTAGGSSYGVGSSGQVLMSNGSTVYWGNAASSDTYVQKAGDTMTGNLTVSKAGGGQVKATNTDNGVSVYLDSASSVGNHGIWSTGYWDGSAFQSDGKWIVYRGQNGNIYLNGRADTAQEAQGIYTTSISPNNSSETHADALKKWFDNNKANITRNQLLACYDTTGGNGSITFGYFLNGYDSNPYGGFFSAHYGTPYYIGISNGTYKQSQIWKKGDAVTGAVYNDYAEYRESHDTEFGYVVQELGDDTLQKTTKRLSHFAGVTSDTWGFAQGETEKAKTPIAVAGRVLVYPGEDRNKYQPGDCVCAGPGGKVYIMTREEIKEWPDRIVGTVSCVPDYDTWGIDYDEERPKVKVNGRIWIKVR